MSHRTHESDPDDIDIDDLYNLKGSPSTGSGGSGPSPWPRPSASAVLTLIAWGLAVAFAHFIRAGESVVDLSWSSRDDVGFHVGDVVRATTGVELFLAVIGALTALALMAAEPGRGRIGGIVVNIVLAGLALSAFLNNWIVLLSESPVRQDVWEVGFLMGVCPAIVLAASIVELHRSATR